MKGKEVVLLLGLGSAIWVLGTLYYANRGQAILETTTARYWIAFVTTPVLSALLCVCILRWMHMPGPSWTSAMLLLAIPGMSGEAVVLTNFAKFMPKLQIASGGKYAAFLFATYAVVLGIAEIVTLSSTPK